MKRGIWERIGRATKFKLGVCIFLDPIMTSGEEVHELFKNLSDALDSLPSNLITELSEPMRDDSLILLHAMDRVLGVNTNIDSDSDTSTECEDESQVCH